NGALTTLSANGQTANSFGYTVAGRSSFKLKTGGAGSSTNAGSISVTPSSGSSTPVPLVVFSFKPGAFTLTQAGVPANSGTAFRMYAEASGSGGVGSIATGIAVANASTSAATVTFDLFSANGAPTGLTKSYPISGNGQIAKFLGEIFPALTLPFQGVLRISTDS